MKTWKTLFIVSVICFISSFFINNTILNFLFKIVFLSSLVFGILGLVTSLLSKEGISDEEKEKKISNSKIIAIIVLFIAVFCTFVQTFKMPVNVYDMFASVVKQSKTTEVSNSIYKADFTSDKQNIIQFSHVLFSDTSVNSPTSWLWEFPGGTPATSKEQHPSIVYNKPGTYNVTLNTINTDGVSTEVKTDYITVKSADISSGKYIIVLQEDTGIASLDVKTKKEKINTKANGLLKKYGVTNKVEEVYETALQGFTAKMTPTQMAKLQKDSLVKYVEEDQIVYINAQGDVSATAKGGGGKPAPKPAPTPTPTPTPTPIQNIPWGITRVGGGATYTGSGSAWVIDTGIKLTHPDLNIDVARGVSFVTAETSIDDLQGHGTHVAGTIGAINNGFGVVGVAAGVKVIPVKVMDSTGYGAFSSVLAGVNHVAANGVVGDVANMSLGGGVSPTIDAAVLAASANVKFAIAAGNESDYAYNHSPGRVNGPNVYTVSAMDSTDKWAYFSNFGNTIVDYCAPGMTVLSTYKNNDYIAMSGTSMSAPHVAGLLLLGPINTSGYVTNDPDGVADPIAHR